MVKLNSMVILYYNKGAVICVPARHICPFKTVSAEDRYDGDRNDVSVYIFELTYVRAKFYSMLTLKQLLCYE